MEGAAVAGGELHAAVEVITPGQCAGVVVAVLAVPVAPRGERQLVRPERGLVLRVRAGVVAAGGEKAGVAVDVLALPVDAERQQLVRGQVDVVLPRGLVAARIDVADEARVLVVVVAVQVLAHAERALPRLQRTEAEGRTGDLLHGAPAVLVAAVEMRLAQAAQPGAGQFGTVVPAVAAAGAEVLVARRIAIRLVGEAAGEGRGGADAAGVDAAGVLAARAQVVPALFAAAGQPELAAQQLVGAGGERQRRFEAAVARAAAGEDLDHAADRIGAVEAGARAAHDLDAFDLLHRNLLERGQPRADRSHPHAIDQQQGVGGIGAAQEQRSLLAVAAGVGEAHAGQAGQQVGDRHRLQPLDVGAADHAHRRQRVADVDRRARGGDDHRLQRNGAVLPGWVQPGRAGTGGAGQHQAGQQGLLHLRFPSPRTRARPHVQREWQPGEKAGTERRTDRPWSGLAHREPPRSVQAGLRAREWRAVIPLAANGAFPCIAQWPSPFVSFAYRCGGSAGLAVFAHHAPASRFIPWALNRRDT